MSFYATRTATDGGVDLIDRAGALISHQTREAMEELVRATLAVYPPLPPPPTPARAERIRRSIRYRKARVIGAIHDRLFADYCNHDGCW